MWRDKILEAKAKKSISTKTIADISQVSEKTVSRILKGETPFPPIDRVLSIGAAVGLSERELFSESNLVVANEDLVLLQTELAQLMDKCVRLEAENVSLSDENDRLRTKLAHKDEILAHKEKIIALYESLQKYQSNN